MSAEKTKAKVKTTIHSEMPSAKDVLIKETVPLIKISLCDFYSFSDLPPSFKNLPNNRIITVDEIGDLTEPMEVYLIEVSDNDRLDIPGLKVSLVQDSPYFKVKEDSSKNIYNTGFQIWSYY